VYSILKYLAACFRFLKGNPLIVALEPRGGGNNRFKLNIIKHIQTLTLYNHKSRLARFMFALYLIAALGKVK
jgi:hypothetical protein